jgi:uncharacterized repeat protein (TIGR01451 family)
MAIGSTGVYASRVGKPKVFRSPEDMTFMNCGGRAARPVGGICGKVVWMVILCVVCAGNAAVADDLEGQSAGNPNWCKDGVQGWSELNYIPGRVVLTGGPSTGRTVTVVFNHTARNSTPEIQFLTGFTPSANVVMTSQPALSSPPGASVWSYTFTVNLLDGNQGQVTFLARLSAGAHLNPAGLMQFSSDALEVAQPHSSCGSPDLAITRVGANTLSPGTVATFTLNYTNKQPSQGATGAQLTEVLPAQLVYVPGSASGNAVLTGNALTWDLGNLSGGAFGSVTYEAVVNTNEVAGQCFTDLAMIFSAENNAVLSDNILKSAMTIGQGCQAPSIVTNPASATSCGGSAACFEVTAAGAAPLGFQWRKNGNAIPGATASALSVAGPSSADAAMYDVMVSNACGLAISGAAALGVGQPIQSGCVLGDGTFQISVMSMANRQYAVQYSTDLVRWTNAATGFTGDGSLLQWIDSSAPGNSQRFYRAILLP